jgi:hypothetical protein
MLVDYIVYVDDRPLIAGRAIPIEVALERISGWLLAYKARNAEARIKGNVETRIDKDG